MLGLGHHGQLSDGSNTDQNSIWDAVRFWHDELTLCNRGKSDLAASLQKCVVGAVPVMVGRDVILKLATRTTTAW